MSHSNQQPTGAQIREFWEWCGFVYVRNIEHSAYWGDFDFSSWICPDSGLKRTDLPPIDLNNFFKYAVPKLATIPNRWDSTSSDGIWFRLECISGVQEYSVSLWTWNAKNPFYETPLWQLQEDPALALFWTIWEIMKDGK